MMWKSHWIVLILSIVTNIALITGREGIQMCSIFECEKNITYLAFSISQGGLLKRWLI
jgi:hypothetical protein